MVTRVLVINNHQLDIRKIYLTLQSAYHSVIFSKSIEEALKIFGTKSVDVIFLAIPSALSEKNNLFIDDFLLLRNICGAVPIVGLIEKSTTIPKILETKLDDVIDVEIPSVILLKKVEVLSQLKNSFDENLLSNVFVEANSAKKISAIFYDDLNFLPESVEAKIATFQSTATACESSSPDLFIVNSEHPECLKCCAHLRLQPENRYIPIILTYRGSLRKQYISDALKIDFGYTDFVNLNANQSIIACRIEALIRYKKIHEDYLRKLKESIYQAAIDSTTEVYNRSFFDNYVKNRRDRLAHCAIIMIDVDKFKTVNDEFGHSFADEMLKYISNTIKNCVRSSDIVARYGGDEFIILMNHVSKETATAVAQRIRKNFEKSSYQNVPCTVSVGVCCIINDYQAIDIYEAISIADKFMYIAKQNGGNDVQICG